MSGVKTKVVLALMLALSLTPMSACVAPVTVDCTPYTCTASGAGTS
ncbi:hypothetical protein [Mycobacterium malmoense]|nr:hypothetical protein [Mycobacterium malmoense]